MAGRPNRERQAGTARPPGRRLRAAQGTPPATEAHRHPHAAANRHTQPHPASGGDGPAGREAHPAGDPAASRDRAPRHRSRRAQLDPDRVSLGAGHGKARPGAPWSAMSSTVSALNRVVPVWRAIVPVAEHQSRRSSREKSGRGPAGHCQPVVGDASAAVAGQRRVDGRPPVDAEPEPGHEQLPVRRVAADVGVVGQERRAVARAGHAHVTGTPDRARRRAGSAGGASPRGRGASAPAPRRWRMCSCGRSSARPSRRGRRSRRGAGARVPRRCGAPTWRPRGTARAAGRPATSRPARAARRGSASAARGCCRRASRGATRRPARP